uniref:Uncharacterized protein n=1 Tax=Oryctolagus cuniculus TaxID=9986 RepID=A0A5F9CB62_RABIT
MNRRHCERQYIYYNFGMDSIVNNSNHKLLLYYTETRLIRPIGGQLTNIYQGSLFLMWGAEGF